MGKLFNFPENQCLSSLPLVMQVSHPELSCGYLFKYVTPLIRLSEASVSLKYHSQKFLKSHFKGIGQNKPSPAHLFPLNSFKYDRFFPVR